MYSEAKSLMDMMSTYKKMIQTKVEQAITPRPLLSVSDLSNTPNEELFWRQIQDYPRRGGKYLRSILVCVTCEALGGKLVEALPTATAMELSQNWILIHDDLEDRSEMRRGDKAHHLKFGEDHSINAGDALHIIMWHALNENVRILDPGRTQRICDEFQNMLLRTAVGQTAEMAARESYDLTEEDVYYILDGKTGYYTIAGPMRLGAMVAGKTLEDDPNLFADINAFGLELGRAFQITDDILDLTSDFDGLKALGNDIQEGKRSVLLVKLLQKLQEGELTTLKAILDKPMGGKTQEDVQQVIDWMHTTGVVAEAKEEAQEYAQKARSVLERLPFTPEVHKRFEELVYFMVDRSY